jgi:CheY-like chemotaxis protein/HPt (histidine-containing phosphotransfer) domain-containing protein
MSGEHVYAHGVEEIADELRREFLDEAAETLRRLDVGLQEARHGRLPTEELVAAMRRAALPLRGQSANFGVRLLGTVALRLEDYLANVSHYPPRLFDDLERFVGTMLDVIEGRIPLDADASQVVRGLPRKVGFDVGDVEVRNVEVMLVMLHGVAAHFVEREMQQCGYRTSVVTSTFEALPLIVRTKPDLVIISAVMPELGGIDLAIALAAMPATRNVPTALITSLDPDDPYLRLLPGTVPVIHKGASFGDDLAEALSRLFLI